MIRLAVPCHAPAEHRIDVGDRAGARLGNAAADDQPVGIEAMHVHVAVGPALKIARDSRPAPGAASSTPVHARSVNSSSSAIRTPLPSRISRSPAVPMKPTGLPSACSASIPASPLVAIAVPRFARQADPRELLLDRFGGSRRVRDQDDAAPLARAIARAARQHPDRASRRRGRRPRCRTGSAGSLASSASQKLIRGQPRRAPARSARRPRDC